MKLLPRAVAGAVTVISVIVLVPPAIASANVKVLPATLPNGPVGQPYSQTITATGGVAPYTFTVSAGTLPAGLTLGSNGTLSGTPASAESSSFTVQATDSSSPAKTATRKYTLVFGLLFSTKSLPNTNPGAGYSKQIVVKGGTAPLTFSLTGGSLPTGLALSSSGLVSGTPNTLGTFKFTVGVTDSGSPQQSASQAFTIKVGMAGKWTLCTYSSGLAGNNIDDVTLASNGTMKDEDGTTGTWALSSSNALTMAFDYRNFAGNLDAPNNQFEGTYTGPDDGSFAMVAGADNGQNCVQP